MLSDTDIANIKFPVDIHTREPDVWLTLSGDGTLWFNGDGGGAKIASCDPQSVQFRYFVELWLSAFADNAMHEPALVQLPRELRAGRIKQDPYYPCLFQDRARGEHLSDGALAYPMLALSDGGSFQRFNDGPYCCQVVMTLAEDDRIKFMPWIVDFEDNDFFDGTCVSFMHERMGKPAFDYYVDGDMSGQAIKDAVAQAPAQMTMESERIREELEEVLPF